MTRTKLIIDFGNTLQKLAIFKGKALQQKSVFSGLETGHLAGFLEANGPFDAIILSSVTSHPSDIEKLLSSNAHFIHLDEHTLLPIKNRYLSPSTLGKDRLAAAAGAFALYSGRNVLSVDAGTCITYDFLNANGEYLGGSISPGMQMRFRAMHEFTGKLPLVRYTGFEGFMGQNTEDSMSSGVVNGICEEIKGVVSLYHKQYKDLTVVITGGDHEFLHNKLKINIFAVPDLVLLGLNEILDHNERER